MEIDFLTLLQRLYALMPNGCLCVEPRDYDNYPFNRDKVLAQVLSIKSAQCKDLAYSDGLPPVKISCENCFELNETVLHTIEQLLQAYRDKEEEIFDGSLAYIKDGKLLFCAIDFIDTVMPPEVIIDNIGIELK